MPLPNRLRLLNLNDPDVEIRFALLSEDDMNKFFEHKAGALENINLAFKHDAIIKLETGRDLYLKYSKELPQILERADTSGRIEVKRYNQCLQKTNDGKLSPLKDKRFPPLGILIADDHTAILSYNTSILSAEPVALEGHITREPEQVRAIREFCASYYEYHTGTILP